MKRYVSTLLSICTIIMRGPPIRQGRLLLPRLPWLPSSLPRLPSSALTTALARSRAVGSTSLNSTAGCASLPAATTRRPHPSSRPDVGAHGEIGRLMEGKLRLDHWSLRLPGSFGLGRSGGGSLIHRRIATAPDAEPEVPAELPPGPPTPAEAPPEAPPPAAPAAAPPAPPAPPDP
jgi:hypothetical protein